MENVFEVLEQNLSGEIKQAVKLILSELKRKEEHIPGVNLDKWIPLKKVSEMYGIAGKTLLAHKGEIVHTKMFGKILFDKQSLSEYMESGKPVPVVKRVMRTRNYAAA